MNKIYIVKSSTGEYEDTRISDIIAYSSEEKTKAITENLNKWAEHNQIHDHTHRRDETYFIDPYLNRKHFVDYTGIFFYYYWIELGD